MRIGIYDPYLDTMSGGKKYMLSLAQCLAKDHKVSILWDKTSKDSIISKARQRFDFDLSEFSFSPSLFHPEISFIDRYRLTRDYDLIVLLSDGSIPLVSCPLVIHFQSPMPWINGRSLKNRLKLNRVKNVICNSQFTKSFIDKTFGIRSEVIYPPVAIQEKADFDKKEKIILNVGRFGINQAGSSFKKQDVLADAFSSMVKDGLKGWKLVLIMSVMEQDKSTLLEFEKKYEDLPIEVVSNPSNDILWRYYTKASFYWHASGYGEDITKHPDRAEHFGISTVEAMGSGCVPIVINAGGQKEIVEDKKNGRLWNTAEELQHYTKELIQDKTMTEELAKEAIRSAKRFSLERFCEEVQRLTT